MAAGRQIRLAHHFLTICSAIVYRILRPTTACSCRSCKHRPKMGDGSTSFNMLRRPPACVRTLLPSARSAVFKSQPTSPLACLRPPSCDWRGPASASLCRRRSSMNQHHLPSPLLPHLCFQPCQSFDSSRPQTLSPVESPFAAIEPHEEGAGSPVNLSLAVDTSQTPASNRLTGAPTRAVVVVGSPGSFVSPAFRGCSVADQDVRVRLASPVLPQRGLS